MDKIIIVFLTDKGAKSCIVFEKFTMGEVLTSLHKYIPNYNKILSIIGV